VTTKIWLQKWNLHRISLRKPQTHGWSVARTSLPGASKVCDFTQLCSVKFQLRTSVRFHCMDYSPKRHHFEISLPKCYQLWAWAVEPRVTFWLVEVGMIIPWTKWILRVLVSISYQESLPRARFYIFENRIQNAEHNILSELKAHHRCANHTATRRSIHANPYWQPWVGTKC